MAEIDKFDPNLGGEQLSKSTSGAMFWTGIVVAITFLPFLIYLSIKLADSGKEGCEERITPYKERISFLLNENRELKEENKKLDSINHEMERRDIINQFNASQGSKQIILTPKNQEK